MLDVCQHAHDQLADDRIYDQGEQDSEVETETNQLDGRKNITERRNQPRGIGKYPAGESSGNIGRKHYQNETEEQQQFDDIKNDIDDQSDDSDHNNCWLLVILLIHPTCPRISRLRFQYTPAKQKMHPRRMRFCSTKKPPLNLRSQCYSSRLLSLATIAYAHDPLSLQKTTNLTLFNIVDFLPRGGCRCICNTTQARIYCVNKRKKAAG